MAGLTKVKANDGLRLALSRMRLEMNYSWNHLESTCRDGLHENWQQKQAPKVDKLSIGAQIEQSFGGTLRRVVPS